MKTIGAHGIITFHKADNNSIGSLQLIRLFIYGRVRVIQNRLIRIFTIINLILLAVILMGRIQFIQILLMRAVKALLIPVVFSAFIFYIIRPLNNAFIKKGLGYGASSLLTVSICTFILGGMITFFSKYAYNQFNHLVRQFLGLINNKDNIDSLKNWVAQFVNVDELSTFVVDGIKNYVHQIRHGFMVVAGYFMNTFSALFLIIVIIFYMLKDGHKFRGKVVHIIPERYRGIADEALKGSDDILSHYVTGQAKVAFSLGIMIFIGYKIIGIPSALLLSTITFILGFIPFVGFFISMIIPVAIALSMGLYMFVKLVIVFIIVQTLKGRVVVPAIMAKSMEIHPLTDIFLVIGAIAAGGPFAAFIIVPAYAIAKNLISIINRKDNMA